MKDEAADPAGLRFVLPPSALHPSFPARAGPDESRSPGHRTPSAAVCRREASARRRRSGARSPCGWSPGSPGVTTLPLWPPRQHCLARIEPQLGLLRLRAVAFEAALGQTPAVRSSRRTPPARQREQIFLRPWPTGLREQLAVRSVATSIFASSPVAGERGRPAACDTESQRQNLSMLTPTRVYLPGAHAVKWLPTHALWMQALAM